MVIIERVALATTEARSNTAFLVLLPMGSVTRSIFPDGCLQPYPIAASQDLAMSITIGKLSQATAVNVETIRYYERIGLLAAPLRTSSGYRSYTAQDVARLRFIKRGRELGFSLMKFARWSNWPISRVTPVAMSIAWFRLTWSRCASASPTCSGSRRSCSAWPVAISRR